MTIDSNELLCKSMRESIVALASVQQYLEENDHQLPAAGIGVTQFRQALALVLIGTQIGNAYLSAFDDLIPMTADSIGEEVKRVLLKLRNFPEEI